MSSTDPLPGDEDRTTSSDARHHLRIGLRLVHDRKPAEAETAFRQAIKLDPRMADAHGNLGVALAHRRQLPEAEAAFRLAIRLDPIGTTAYVNLARCLLEQNRHPEAEQWARQAIQLNPDLPEPHRLLGGSLEARKQHDAAVAAYREAVRLDPRDPQGHFRLGRLLGRCSQHEEAEKELREAVRMKPAFAQAWSVLGNLLMGRDRYPEALECIREAVRHDAKSADIHDRFGVALAACEQFEEAERAYREAIRLAPRIASAYSNLGNTLRALGRPEEAEKSLREALRLHPKYPEAHNNIGIVLTQLGREQEAVQAYEEALKIRPEYPEARLNRSLTWLCDGDFARGWPEYEWRLKVKPNRHKQTPGPRWDGSALEGKRLLITSEQGLGDSIHLIRYAKLAQARGLKVLFDCPTPLASLVATCPGVDRVAIKDGPPIVYDVHVPLASMPGLFGIPPEAATAPVPYFTPDAQRVEYWGKELADVPGLKVGIAWQGSKAHKGDRFRSVALTRFAPLAAVPGTSLISLQKGPGSEQLTDGSAAAMGVVDFGSRTDSDMADVAALMMNLDLVATVDTALAHLAGALGVPVLVAIPFAPDWRWLRNREDTPWYPTMKLVRQHKRGEWDSVFGRMAAILSGLVRAKNGEPRPTSPPPVERTAA